MRSRFIETLKKIKRSGMALRWATGLILLGCLLAAGILTAGEYNMFQKLVMYIREQMHPVLFIGCMFVLPIFGFPINVLLVLSGLRFETGAALLLWMSCLPIHVIVSYYLATRLRSLIEKMLKDKMGFTIPRIPRQHSQFYLFLFFLIPGPPYAIKNYGVPLAGIPFRNCVWLNMAVQGALGIPLIIVGDSVVKLDAATATVVLVVLVLMFSIMRLIKRKYGKTLE